MPQKFRQRGKKKSAADKKQQQQQHHYHHEENDEYAAGPSHGRRYRDNGDKASGFSGGGFGNSNLIPLGGGSGYDAAGEEVMNEAEETTLAGQEGEVPAHIPVDLGAHLEAETHESDVAPFGFVPPELKAYLKDAYTNLLQLDAESRRSRNEYYTEGAEGEEDDEEEEGGQSGLLRQAMLREINEQELTVATDGECSVALETIIDGLDARRVRILADRASGR